GVVGFISPVSEPYCGTCNRMRLTADGRFHLCLLNDDEMDVRATLRNGGDLEAVAEILLRAVTHKPVGHRLHTGRFPGGRQMFQIGGCRPRRCGSGLYSTAQRSQGGQPPEPFPRSGGASAATAS